MATDNDSPVIKFDLPKNMLIVGSTQSGKTQFVKRLLLNHENAFKQKVGLIIYCYGAWQPAFEEMEV
jgi:Cdc6-like AAA superfamily ATPase